MELEKHRGKSGVVEHNKSGKERCAQMLCREAKYEQYIWETGARKRIKLK